MADQTTKPQDTPSAETPGERVILTTPVFPDRTCDGGLERQRIVDALRTIGGDSMALVLGKTSTPDDLADTVLAEIASITGRPSTARYDLQYGNKGATRAVCEANAADCSKCPFATAAHVTSVSTHYYRNNRGERAHGEHFVEIGIKSNEEARLVGRKARTPISGERGEWVVLVEVDDSGETKQPCKWSRPAFE